VREGDPVVFDVLSTRRPSPPQIHSVLPLFRNTRKVEGGVLTSTHEAIGVRVWLKRPWFTTGEDERLGISVAANQDSGAFPDDISRWGVDPYEAVSFSGPHLVPEMIVNRLEVRNKFGLEDNIPSGASIVGVEVRFDASRDLWFADIEFDLIPSKLAATRWAMLKLALVRFQPGTQPVFGQAASSLVHTDFITLPPSRTLTAHKVGADRVNVSVSGSYRDTTRFVAQWQQRAIEPLDSLAPDVCISQNNPATLIDLIADVPIVPQRILRPADFGLAIPEAMAGRIVVEEWQQGWELVRPREMFRTVWLDAFDIAELDGAP
jgi:hypothetical protein